MVGLDLESILSSRCRRRIINYLVANGSCNIMRLVAGINSKYPQVNAELQVLRSEGIVEEKRVGSMRMISLNKENPDTAVLVEALKLLHGNEK